MSQRTTYKEQTQYHYDNQSWLYDYLFAFFYGFVHNDNYVYDAKPSNSINILPITSYTYDAITDYIEIAEDLFNNMIYNEEHTFAQCSDGIEIELKPDFYYFRDILGADELEAEQYFYHSDHLGSASWITDASGTANQHLQYLPFGELLVDERSSGHDVRFKFTGKERDAETGFDYFGARYYDSHLSIWLSVDPLSDARPGLSPYNYCQLNPVMRVDPTGALDGWYVDRSGTIIGRDKNNDDKVYLVQGYDEAKVREDKFVNGVAQSDLRNDIVEMPNLNQRDILSTRLMPSGENDKSVEYGTLLYASLSGDGNYSGISYKGTKKNIENNGNLSGAVDFRDTRQRVGTFGSINDGDKLYLSVIAHVHNLKSRKDIPPTPGGDKLGGGANIGVVFTYPKEGNKVYIYNSNTKFRSKYFMSSDVFSRPFITPDGKKL